MACAIGQNTLFGGVSNYIKFHNGDLIAVEGPNTVERQMLSDLRFYYKQLLRGRIILKPGQVNYLMNHLGLGDNATFVSLAVRYDQKSNIEEENYVNWSFYDDLTKIYPLGKYMCLTGNSTDRVKQLYLSNPSTKYSVNIDVMVAVLDDSYNFFTDTVNQSGTSFVNLRWTDLKSYVVGESIKFLDSQGRELIYIILNNINAIEISGKILIIDDNALGRLFFQFITEFDARQVNSVLNFVLDNPNINIDTLVADTVPPTIFWYSNVNNSATASYITLGGVSDGVPYNTTQGSTFSTSISLLEFGGLSQSLSKSKLIELLIDKVVDNRDGTMSLSNGNIILTGTQGQVSEILSGGDYKMKFTLSDVAGNDNSNIEMNLNILDQDTTPPIVYWKTRVNNQVGQPLITFMGATISAPYNSSFGKTFSTTILFPEFQVGGEITKQKLLDITVDKVVDNIDGEIPLSDFNLILTDSLGQDIFTIFENGNYSMTFNITDDSENSLFGVYLNFDVVSQLPPTQPPIIYWFTTVGESPNTSPIFCGDLDLSQGPFNTAIGNDFNTSINFNDFAIDSKITKMGLYNILINYVLDPVSGPITLDDSNIFLSDLDGSVEFISVAGFYSMTFSLLEGTNNKLEDISMVIEII